uniref:Metalloendopeptidase n=1 Tax=Glossina morsitans morsitans TaxID=37546 RepID=A0A1B0GF11_GLOMM
MFNEQQFLLPFLIILCANGIKGARNLPICHYVENPEETGQYHEGDIVLDDRNGILSAKSKWPKHIVPYVLKGSFSKKELSIINHVLSEFHQKTCIRFQKRKNENDFLIINNKSNGCWSSVGRLGGSQELNLESTKCFTNYGTTIHELMHTLGFYHEQNRYDRDDYVKVLWDNIENGMKVNFEKLKRNVASGYGVAYDYGSIMHYKATSFSKNGQPTLKALKKMNEDFKKMGQRQGFSARDINKINKMYKC